MPDRELTAIILIIGASVGGVAAALGAAAVGKSVLLTEEYDWIGGQLTSQAVPPDENSALRANTGGGTKRYLDFRRRARDYYRRNYPLTDAAKKDPKLNPGGGGSAKSAGFRPRWRRCSPPTARPAACAS